MITQKKLKEVMHYDPETGKFTWLKKTRPTSPVVIGSEAGRYDKDGYKIIMIYGKNYRAHRLAYFYMTGEFPDGEIDHINQVKDDNRWCNLRVVTRSQNLVNRGNVRGYYWHIRDLKWVAHIKINRKHIHLGNFDTKLAAAYARHLAEIKYGFKEFMPIS